MQSLNGHHEKFNAHYHVWSDGNDEPLNYLVVEGKDSVAALRFYYPAVEAPETDE